MKKNVLFLAAGLLALCACSKDEVTDMDNGGAVKFRPTVGTMTRGTLVTTANITSFKVTSYLTGSSANYFTDLQVNKSGTAWNTASTHYWPGTGTLNFFAYSPTDVATVAISPTGRSINAFTPETSVAAQKDVVVAFNTGTKTANESAGVALNFKHILSQIEIQAKSGNTAAYEIKVLGVKLCRIPSTANFTFHTTSVSTTLPETQWSAPATAKDYAIKLDAAETLTGDAKNITKSNFLMIPQQLTPWDKSATANGAYISVLCQISSKSGGTNTQIYPDAAGRYAYAAVPISTKWLPGKKYTYTLNFLGSGGAGNVDPSPQNPENPSDPQVDDTPGTGGNPVLGGAIKFTVTVDEWDAVGEEELSL